MYKDFSADEQEFKLWNSVRVKAALPEKDKVTSWAGLTLLFLMGFSLNQSAVLFGANLSSSDAISIFLVGYIIYKKGFAVPKNVLLLFILISTVSLLTAFFIVPAKFSFNPSLGSVGMAFIKLLASFVYLLIGINLTKIHKIDILLKYFSYSALLIALAGIFLSIVRIGPIHQILFYAGTRFKGLMNDPNYFSILQNIAIVYFIRADHIKKSLRHLIVLILIYSVLLSGSKTGVITVIASIVIIYFEKVLWEKKNFNKIVKAEMLLLILLLLSFALSDEFLLMLNNVSSSNPAFERIQLIFQDFNASMTSGGSDRVGTWEVALRLLGETPLVGVGIGTYTGVIAARYNYSTIPHNTYLQLAVEWGLPLTILFFSIVFIFVLKAQLSRLPEITIFKNMMLALLIGSAAVSLNNARIFWIIFGALLYQATHVRRLKTAV